MLHNLYCFSKRKKRKQLLIILFEKYIKNTMYVFPQLTLYIDVCLYE